MRSSNLFNVEVGFDPRPVAAQDEARLEHVLAECWEALSRCICAEPQLIRSNLLLTYDVGVEAMA